MSTIFLRAMEPEDIESIYQWENDPSVWTCSIAHQPFSRQALTQFINENSSADIYTCRQLRLMADREEITVCRQELPGQSPKNIFSTHHTVGCVDLFDFDPYHHRAAVGIIVDSQYRRQGIGLQILNALDDFSRQHLQLHQLHCIISADNDASIALFEKAGYSRCGTLAQWVFSCDKWTDAFIYQKILV